MLELGNSTPPADDLIQDVSVEQAQRLSIVLRLQWSGDAGWDCRTHFVATRILFL